MIDYEKILNDMSKISQTLLKVYQSKEISLYNNQTKILELFNKIDRAIAECQPYEAKSKQEAYLKLIAIINAQNELINAEQKSLLTVIDRHHHHEHY
jgi:hypothetical protein